MVSQPPPVPPTSRDRLLAAAATEFAARGFDGAKVDRIAAKARVNKAMLYYHFKSKAGLYREIITDMFRGVADGVAAIDSAGTPEDRIRGFVRTIAAQASARPHFPSIWLREMAEGGRHLDRTVVAEVGRILQVLAAILSDGRNAGVFGPAQPLVTQMGIVGPLLLHAVSGPILARLGPDTRVPPVVERDDMIAHIEAGTLAAIRAGNVRQSATGSRRPRK